MDLVFRGNPRSKHMSYRKYKRFIEPYLASLTDKPFDVICAFRHPEDWLQSWWRYRRREALRGSANSTRGLSFDHFVDRYLDGQQKPADVGRQARFVARDGDEIGVSRVFRYDRIERMVRFLQERLETEISLERLNVSPKAPFLGGRLGNTRRVELRTALARDYEIYESVAE
ncbi:MAG: gamma-glutamyl kinase [Pseudomonadota bacterium]